MTATFEEIVESVDNNRASVRELFEGDSRLGGRGHDPRRLAEAITLYDNVLKGRKPMYYLQEAMTRSDFPLLFADILDRQLLGSYQETTPTWAAYAKRGVVNDFRTVKRFAVDGAEGPLDPVEEMEEYKEGELSEDADTYSVRKYGRKLGLSWEALINDDLDALRDLPSRLARGARRTESRFATSLFVDENGPHASLYNGGFGNIVPGNPALSIEGLQEAFITLSRMVDEDNEPIVLDVVTLVVPPALEVTAMNILNALQIEASSMGGSSDQVLIAQNWMKNKVNLAVEPYIPHVASTDNGDTSWWLFPQPSVGRPALEVGFLRGYEEPALYEKVPDARRVGGGEVLESFDNDSRQWRVRHVFGGTRLVNTGGYRVTVASNGSEEAS